MAGKKLQTITEELDKTNHLLGKGDSQLKAAKLHGNIIQILALISLAFIAGASPFFILVSNMLYYPFKESSVIMTSAFEPIFFITALVISILPIRRISIRGHEKDEPIPWRDVIRFSKFILFLITYAIVKNVFLGMY